MRGVFQFHPNALSLMSMLPDDISIRMQIGTGIFDRGIKTTKGNAHLVPMRSGCPIPRILIIFFGWVDCGIWKLR